MAIDTGREKSWSTVASWQAVPWPAAQIEFCADLYLRAQSIGEPKTLSDQQITEVIARLESYKRQQ